MVGDAFWFQYQFCSILEKPFSFSFWAYFFLPPFIYSYMIKFGLRKFPVLFWGISCHVWGGGNGNKIPHLHNKNNGKGRVCGVRYKLGWHLAVKSEMREPIKIVQ